MRTHFLSAALAVFVTTHATLAGTFTVTTNADSGAGSLRQAILDANADNTSPRTISFAIGTGVQTITLASALPQITRPATIDGTTQAGFTGAPLIVIDGNLLDADGLAVNYTPTGDAGPEFKALCIVRFGTNGGVARHGINLLSGDPGSVTGCYIGINASGTTAARNTGAGILYALFPAGTPQIIGGATAADRNVISGNLGAGVQIDGFFITVSGNYIGTSADGQSAVPNGGDGVTSSQSTQVKIGTATLGAGNVISGNAGNGVHLTAGASVKGNIIGLGADGSAPLGNNMSGVFIDNTTATIGGATADRNVISKNGSTGVRVAGPTGTASSIQNNFIGTDITGMLARGNTSHGVEVTAGKAGIGSNVISGNTGSGVRLAAGVSTSNSSSVSSNKIGVTTDATAKIGNGGDGITVANVPTGNLSNNIIGGNTGAGIAMSGANAADIFITGNFIGTDSGGIVNLGNTSDGIALTGGAINDIIGANAFASGGNVIAYNSGAGVKLASAQNDVRVNSIFANGGLAIDAPASSSTVNPPAISAPSLSGADLTFTLTHDAAPNKIYTYRVYGNDVSSGPEAQMQVTAFTGTTDGSGHFETTRTITGGGSTGALPELIEPPEPQNKKPGDGDTITAAATTNNGSTPPNNQQTKVGPGATIGGGSSSGGTDTTGNLNQSGNTNDPINTFTGELFGLEAVMLNLRGPMPLMFARYYASKITSDAQIASALGRNRLHNFDSKLTLVDATHITAAMSDGRIMQFSKPAAVWVLDGPLDVAFQLVESGSAFILADPRSQGMWTFDANGVLTKIEDGRGNAHTLTYTASRLTSVSDGLGRTLSFAYTGDKLTSVTDGTRTVSFTYNGEDLATASDALNHVTTYTYDGSGHLLLWQRPRGNTPYSQTYASDRVAAQTEHPDAMTNNAWALAYDTGTRETTITDPTMEARVHTHSAIGQLTRFTDEDGGSVEIAYDAQQRRSAITDRLGRITRIAYHLPSGLPASVTHPDGTTMAWSYKARVLIGVTFHDLVKITHEDGTSRSFTYDAKGNMLTATDQLGKKSSFTYDAHGRVLTATNRTGGVTTFTYDAAGNLATSKDSDSGIGMANYTHDAFGRLTKITHPDATHFDIAYDAADRITSVTDERSNSYVYTYDENENVTVITDPAGKTTKFAYDALDRATQFTDRLDKVSSRTFDSRDWEATMTDENSNTTTLSHDMRQRLASMTDAGGATTTFGYNDEAELTSVTDPLGHERMFVRNQRGQIVAMSDALGHTWQVERDARQRVSRIIDPLGRATAVLYDKRGLLIGASRDGAGAASYVRDAAGRLAKVTDPNKGVWGFAWSPSGRLSARTDPLGRKFAYSYDARGRLAAVALPDGGMCTITRNAASEVTQLAYTGEPTLDYAYDSLNRLMGTTGVVLTRDAEGRITNSQQGGLDFTAGYDDAGRLTSVGYNNGAFTVSYTYDTRDRLLTVTDNNPSGANSVTFTYDDADRVTGLVRSNNVNATFTYDNADRLTRIQDGTFLDLKYVLNADGDITATDMTAPLLPAVQAEAKTFTFDKASQINTTGFIYDARGRLTAMPGHTFAWDGASRLVTLDGTALGYDGFGDMITRGTTRYFYHHAVGMHALVAERENGTFTRYYVWTPGGELLWAVDVASGAPNFYHFDRVGSTLALTNGAGTVIDSYAYSPYGEPLGHGGTPGTSTQPFTFCGAFGIRAEGPLYQMRARYYEPITARFLSRDPAPPRIRDVRTLDPYLYAFGNPTSYVDVTGAYPVQVNGEFEFAAKVLFGIDFRPAMVGPNPFNPRSLSLRFVGVQDGYWADEHDYDAEDKEREERAEEAYWREETIYGSPPPLPTVEVFTLEDVQTYHRSVEAAEELKAEALEWARPVTPVPRPRTPPTGYTVSPSETTQPRYSHEARMDDLQRRWLDEKMWTERRDETRRVLDDDIIIQAVYGVYDFFYGK